jgi:hypothetical protein
MNNRILCTYVRTGGGRRCILCWEIRASARTLHIIMTVHTRTSDSLGLHSADSLH